MTNPIKQILVAGVTALVVVLIALGFYSKGDQAMPVVQQPPTQIGGSISTIQQTFDRGFTAGPDGTVINELRSTTCNLAIAAARLPLATSTQPFQCAITAVASGDQVWVAHPSDGGSQGRTGGITLGYAKASSTAGYIEVGLFSRPTSVGTTVATSSFTLATTSVHVLYIDN